MIAAERRTLEEACLLCSENFMSVKTSGQARNPLDVELLDKRAAKEQCVRVDCQQELTQ